MEQASQGLAWASHGLNWASQGLDWVHGGQSGQMARCKDGLRKIPRVLDDFVTFGAAAQKAKLRVPRANLTVL